MAENSRFTGTSTWFRTGFRAGVRAALLALAAVALWPAASQAATLGTFSAMTIPAVVLTGSQSQADAAVLGPQSFKITTDIAYPTTTHIDFEIDITGASFSSATQPAIGGAACQTITVVQSKLLFIGCAPTTAGTVAFPVSNVSYTGASGLAVPSSTIGLSGIVYNSANTAQIFEFIPGVTALTTTAVPYTLTATTAGAGTGTISVSPQAPTYAYGSVITLTANAAGGSAFSAWGGACSGSTITCTVTIAGNTTVTATFVRASTYTLTTGKNGTGTGAISVNPVGSAYPAGTVVTVTATPASGSAVAGWSGGGCSGTATTCQVTMTANQAVLVTFNSTLVYNLAVNTLGSGTGTVAVNPVATTYLPGASVILTASAASGTVFAGWSGACTGTALTCTITMNANKVVGATFNTIASYTLTRTTQGTGTGTISASPDAASYLDGTTVTLTAAAASGSTFTGWSGAGCSGTASTCTVTMNANQAVAGTFTRYTTGILRQAGVVSSASTAAQSFLRFYNASGSAGTVTVTLSDYASGITLGQWTSPSIAPGTAPQYAIAAIESAVPGFSGKPVYYSVTMQAQFDGTFQHVLWKPGDGTLTNLSTCDSGITAVPKRVANVHSSLLGGAGYPSSIVVYNTSTVAAPVLLNVADAATGATLGTYSSTPIPGNGQLVLPVSALETAIGISPSTVHYIVTVQNLFTGYLQHLLNNTQVGVITDMSTVCTFPAGTAAPPTNPSGVN